MADDEDKVTPLRPPPDFRKVLVEQREAEERRREAAQARLKDGLAAVSRLLKIAKSDTGQARRVADFLLAWWNPDSCGMCDMRDMWAVDSEIADDMVIVFRLIADFNKYPDAYGFGGDFDRLIELWRPALLEAEA